MFLLISIPSNFLRIIYVTVECKGEFLTYKNLITFTYIYVPNNLLHTTFSVDLYSNPWNETL